MVKKTKLVGTTVVESNNCMAWLRNLPRQANSEDNPTRRTINTYLKSMLIDGNAKKKQLNKNCINILLTVFSDETGPKTLKYIFHCEGMQ